MVGAVVGVGVVVGVVLGAVVGAGVIVRAVSGALTYSFCATEIKRVQLCCLAGDG